MRVVVYDRELHEPLTIINVPMEAIRRAAAGDPYWRVPAELPINLTPSLASGPEELTSYIVTLKLERVVRGGWSEGRPLFWYAYPDDPELVLLCRAAFLPGQVAEVQRREKVAYIRGLFSALAP